MWAIFNREKSNKMLETKDELTFYNYVLDAWEKGSEAMLHENDVFFQQVVRLHQPTRGLHGEVE